MSDTSKPFFTQAVEAMQAGDLRAAGALLHRELESGQTPRQFLPNVQQFAMRIGEVELALYAARQAIDPGSVESLLAYWSLLASTGRGAAALADMEQSPPAVQSHPMVMHLRGALLAERGRFDEAEKAFRRVLARFPGSLQTWAALAQLKTFIDGDPDVAAMVKAVDTPNAPPRARASLFYGLGKAFEDLGDTEQAFDYYAQGAALRRKEGRFDIAAYRKAADTAIASITPDTLARLSPSTVEGTRSLFVTGMPRSGTTLTEQLLVGHSLVAGGAELNLLHIALAPAGRTLEEHLAYQDRFAADDPWGRVAADYSNLVDAHFGHKAPVVDKSLGEWTDIGLMLHAMPDARVAWLRRDPQDVALSCFATDFTSGLNWTFSLDDIADMMMIEDKLFAHWQSVFPDKILEVPYAALVAAPEEWAERLQKHFNLPVEQGLAQASREGRTVQTASQAQVRDPITARRVGRAEQFAEQLAPFRARYTPPR